MTDGSAYLPPCASPSRLPEDEAPGGAVVLLTGCVFPRAEVTVSDSGMRAAEGMLALLAWLETAGVASVTAADAGDWEWPERQAFEAHAEALGKRVEFLSLGIPAAGRAGKGREEALLLAGAWRESALLRRAGSFYKCTARLHVHNFSLLHRSAPGHSFLMQPEDSRFWRVNAAGAQKLFEALAEETDESGGPGGWMEAVLTRRLAVEGAQRFVERPLFTGRSGTTGRVYDRWWSPQEQGRCERLVTSGSIAPVIWQADFTPGGILPHPKEGSETWSREAEHFICRELFVSGKTQQVTGEPPKVHREVLELVAGMELLRIRGGVFLQPDMEILRPLEPALHVGFLHFAEEVPGHAGTAVLASPEGHPFWDWHLRQVRRLALEAPEELLSNRWDADLLIGAGALSRSLRLWLEGVSGKPFIDKEGRGEGEIFSALRTVRWTQGVVDPWEPEAPATEDRASFLKYYPLVLAARRGRAAGDWNEERPSVLTESPRTVTVTDLPAYLIALPDRREGALTRLRALGWRDITALPSVPLGYPEGVSRGHGEALEAALARGIMPFVILEDDAHATEDWRPVTLPPPSLQADALYLFQEQAGATRAGWDTLSRWEDLDGDFVRLHNMLGLYGQVILTKEYARAMHRASVEAYRLRLNTDIMVTRLMHRFRVLGLWRPVIYQGPYETNRNAARSRLRLPRAEAGRLAGGKVIYGWAGVENTAREDGDAALSGSHPPAIHTVSGDHPVSDARS